MLIGTNPRSTKSYIIPSQQQIKKLPSNTLLSETTFETDFFHKALAVRQPEIPEIGPDGFL